MKGSDTVTKQIKRSAEQKRLQIAERLKQEPSLSDRAVGRQLSVSPHTVASVRKLMDISRTTEACANARLGAQSYDWLNDPWILENRHIIDTIRSPRALRAVKSGPEVIRVMQERGVGAVRAQQILNLQRKAEIKATNGIAIADKNIIIKEDDLRTGLSWIPDHSCDVVCCDPPYGKEYSDPNSENYIYADIAIVANRILKPNGNLLVLTGSLHLPAIMKSLTDGANKTNLRYKWTITVLLPRCTPTSLMLKGIMTGYKPVIWFHKKGPRVSKPALVYDVIEAPKDLNDKSLHKWQQSEHVFIELLSRFDHDVVADICCGSGTTITAAIKTCATKVYACDCDTQSITTTKKRVKQTLYDKKSKPE
jgi:16S rRNA G966 N2-methylase RsmD